MELDMTEFVSYSYQKSAMNLNWTYPFLLVVIWNVLVCVGIRLCSSRLCG